MTFFGKIRMLFLVIYMEGIGHILQKFEKTKFGVYKSQMEEKNMKFSEKINKKVSSKKGGETTQS